MENNTQNILISRRKEFINDIDKKLFNKLVTQLSQIKPNCFLV